MKNANLKWREQNSMNRHDCKPKCCKTALGTCWARYQCRCHVPLDVNK